jgi:hypothetical protein
LPISRVITDPLLLLAYGGDASFYRLLPKAVVKVHNEEEVSKGGEGEGAGVWGSGKGGEMGRTGEGADGGDLHRNMLSATWESARVCNSGICCH